MGSKTYVIKCYKCKTQFDGPSISSIMYDHNIKKDRRGYFCDCKVIEEMAMQKKKAKRFSIEDFGA